MSEDLRRRQYVRVEVSLPVEFTLEEDARVREGGVVDLGAGGMRLVASCDLPPRANIGLRFTLPGTGRTILARGRVVLSFFSRAEQKFHHGIAFTSIDADGKAVIAEFVEGQRLEHRA